MTNWEKLVYLNSYILLAWAGLIFLLLIYQFSPRSEVPHSLIFILLFISICLLGMLAAVYPRKCLKIFKIETVNEYSCKDNLLKNKGHHPDCGMFKGHVFTFKKKKYCVGCTGLLTGALAAVFTCIFYWFYGASEIFFYGGWLIVALSLLQINLIKSTHRLLKLLANLGLVWGSALILVALIDYSNPLVIIYFIVYIVLLVWTRTVISQGNHEMICANCQM